MIVKVNGGEFLISKKNENLLEILHAGLADKYDFVVTEDRTRSDYLVVTVLRKVNGPSVAGVLVAVPHDAEELEKNDSSKNMGDNPTETSSEEKCEYTDQCPIYAMGLCEGDGIVTPIKKDSHAETSEANKEPVGRKEEAK